MAFNINLINKSIRLYVLILLGISTMVTSNIDCEKKPFHCVNSTHFMICVDLGGGVSQTIDNHVFECPSPTVCQPSNSFECEFPEATTPPSRVSDVTNEFNNNKTLWSENTVATISPLTNTSEVIQPEAIMTIDVTSTTTTNSYIINVQNITDNASNHTDGLLINFTPGNMDEKTEVSNNDIIRNVTTAFDSTTLPVDSTSSSTNMSTDESTTTFTIYITSEDIVNETASTNNILGVENVTETTERINSSTDLVTSSTFLILNKTNSKTDSLSTDIESSTTPGDSNASRIDIPPIDNTNKSVVSGDALKITNKTENVFPTGSQDLHNSFVTLPPVPVSSEGILTTLVINEGTEITVSTDTSAIDKQTEYKSSVTPITNNINETNVTDGLISKDGITGEVETTTARIFANSKNVTTIVETNNLPIDSVTSNNVNVTNQITEATTISTEQGLSFTYDYQLKHNTNKNYTSSNIGNNETLSTVDEQPKDNINKSDVSSNAIEIKNKSETRPQQEVALPNIPVTLPSVVVNPLSESTITTIVITDSTANAMATTPLITDITNDLTVIVEPINLPIDSVTSTIVNVNTDVITKVIDDATILTDESISSTIDNLFEVTTSEYDMSNNVTNNITVSMIDEQPKHNANKSEVTKNSIEIENRIENVLFTSPEGVLSNISVTFPSVTVSSEGSIITLVTTEATEITTSADKRSASAIYNQSQNKSSATDIINNISEHYSTSETSTISTKIGATGANAMATTPLITDITNDLTAIVEPNNLPIDSVTSTIVNVNTDVITKVIDDATILTDESISSTIDNLFEVTTSEYDLSNNVTNNITVSMTNEQPKHNANKSEVTNNATEIENRTENILFTGLEGVLSNISVTFPSVTLSSEGTIITLAITEATDTANAADEISASTKYNQSENKSSASAINNHFSGHFSTTEAFILTLKTADTSANETTPGPTIADTKNNETAIVEPIPLPIDSVTSNNVNENKDEINQINVAKTVSTDQSVQRSTTGYLFELTTNKYDMSEYTIEEQLKENVNKSDVSNNTIEIGNRTENGLIIDSEAASSNVSISLPSLVASGYATASTAVITEGTTITILIDENLPTVTDNQLEENTSVTDLFNNIYLTNFTTENITFTSQSVTAGPIETIASSIIAAIKNESVTVQPNTSSTVTSFSVTENTEVLTDKDIRPTIDSQFQVSTNKHDTSQVNNNKTVSTIDENPKDISNESNVSNSAIETKNRTENLLPPGSEVALPIITVTVPSVRVSNTDVITEGIATIIYTNNNSASTMGKQPEDEISATTIINNTLETNSTTDDFTLTKKTNEYKTTTAAIIAPTKNITPVVVPINLPTDLVTSLNSKQDVVSQVTESTTFSKDQSLSSNLDYEFEHNTNKYNITENVNNKISSTIDGSPQENVNKTDDFTNVKEIENQTENSLLIESEATLSNISKTLPPGAAASEATITTNFIREDTNIPISTEKYLASSIGKQTEDNRIVTDFFNNISVTNFTTENLNSTSQKVTTDPNETITVPITKDEKTIIEPITLTIASVISNYTNKNQDIVIPVTEITVNSNDLTSRSTFDYQFEANTNQHIIPHNDNNKFDINEAVNISNGKFNKNPNELPLDSVTLSLVEASSEGIVSAAVDITNVRPISETDQETTTGINTKPEIKIHESASSNNKLQINKTEKNFQPAENNLQTTKVQGILIPSNTKATDMVYDLPGGAEILLGSTMLSTVSPIPTESSQDTLLNFNKANSVNRTDTENETNTYSIDKQFDANATSDINNSIKYVTDTTTVSTSTVSLTGGERDIYEKRSDTSNSLSIPENKSNKTENNVSFHDDLNLTTHIAQSTKNPINSDNEHTVSLVKMQSVYDFPHEKGSSINNGFTNVMQEGTRDVINDFNKNNNVISTTSTPMSTKTNNYEDSNTISTTHKSPSQLSTSHVIETDYSMRNSTGEIGQVSNNNPLVNIVFNNNNTNIQPITTSVINETNWNSKINLNLSNSTKPSSEDSLLKQNTNNKHSHDNRNSNVKRSEVKFNCNHHRRGRYADQDNCRKFYICIGRLAPIVGECPANTVFSEHTKQCTKNLSHCVRGNQFHCETSGRFSDLTQQSVYYICVKNKLDSYVRFKFQCQKGYSLDKETVRCIETESEHSISNDNDSENERKRNRHGYRNEQRRQRQNDERDSEDERSESKEFECEEEGKFAHPDNCRQYYKCSKNRRSQYRRRIKSCDSDEVFDESKKKCVDAESYECQRK